MILAYIPPGLNQHRKTHLKELQFLVKNPT